MLTQKEQLHHALRKVARLADGKDYDALGYVHLQAENGTLALPSTDLNVWFRVMLPCEGDLAACAIAPKPLLDFAKPLDKSDRTTPIELMAVEDNSIVAAVEGAMTRCFGMPIKDYPTAPKKLADIPKPTALVWEADEVRRELAWVAKAATTDESRFHLLGVLLDRTHTVATDGYRLHLAKLPGFDTGAVVPGAAIATVVRSMPKSGTLQVERFESFVAFSTDSWRVLARPIPETFPTYQQIIPRGGGYSVVEIATAGVLRALKQLPPRTERVRLLANGALEFIVDGERFFTLAAPILSHRGPDSDVNVNPAFLKEAVTAGDEVTTMRFGSKLDPVCVESAPGRLAVIMPMSDR